MKIKMIVIHGELLGIYVYIYIYTSEWRAVKQNESDKINRSTTRHPADGAVTWKGWSNDGGLKEVDTKFLELKTKFKELETKFKELETKFMEMETKFKELVTKFKELHNWENQPDTQLKESEGLRC